MAATGRVSGPATRAPVGEAPVLSFARQEAFAAWLRAHHASSPGLWLRLAKKGSGVPSVSYPEAVEVALCYGWIDGQKKSFDDASWLQKFTPRAARSIWSKINRQKAGALIKAGRMKPAGLAAVALARKDGRWAAAYDSPRGARVPSDLQAALDASPRAAAFFATLDGSNRYAILWRLQTAKKAETRARRLQELVRMLSRRETLHPRRRAP